MWYIMCSETNRILECSANHNLILKAKADYEQKGRGVKIIKM